LANGFWEIVWICLHPCGSRKTEPRPDDGGVHKTVLKKTDLGICLTGLEQRKSLHEQYLDSV
jgi:hypothetical protein